MRLQPYHWAKGMSASVDSEAYFDARMVTLGIPMPVQADMRTRGWTSMGSYAFASPYQPGQADESAFVQGVLVPVLGANHAVDIASPRLRRLYFEAHTISVQDLRRRVERSDDDPPLKLPNEERAARLTRLRNRLPGMVISGQSEPSHKLVDLLAQQLDLGQVSYVHWTRCTSKMQEVQGQKSDTPSRGTFQTDGSGVLKIVPVAEGDKADCTSDLLLQQALTRRSIAYELAGLCPVDDMEMLTAKLMREYMRPALEGHQSVSLAQVERADRHVFAVISERTMHGLQMVGGVHPMQTALAAAMLDHEFSYLLMQLPRSTGSSSKAVVEKPDVDMAPALAAAASARQAKREAKGKGKGKTTGPDGVLKPGKSAKKNVTRTKAGKPLCFADQRVSVCDKAEDGEVCPRGIHLCWIRDCEEPHPGCKHGK